MNRTMLVPAWTDVSCRSLAVGAIRDGVHVGHEPSTRVGIANGETAVGRRLRERTAGGNTAGIEIVSIVFVFFIAGHLLFDSCARGIACGVPAG
ncbi:hypothetical protein [Jatrophihabitans sp.]|uniref:hypothetical protein n=1 Tax=Jatrophihabitans sp. TaxID=1932789 RepID=UPI002E17D020